MGVTFQRSMNSSFGHFLNKIIVIYLDDMIFFSRRRKKHLRDLKLVLQRCREHGMSLNPKKCVFCVTEEKCLGHLVSKDGIRIDPKQVQAIQQLCIPSNHTGIHSFFGQIYFLRRFVPNFTKPTRTIAHFLSEKLTFKWSDESF